MNHAQTEHVASIDWALYINQLDCGSLRLVPKQSALIFDIAQATTCSLSWLLTESGQFSSEKLNLGRLHIPISHFSIMVIRLFCFKIVPGQQFLHCVFYLLLQHPAIFRTSYTDTYIAIPDCPVSNHYQNFTIVIFYT